MSKKTFKSQASSNRAISGNALVGGLGGLGFGLPVTATFSQGTTSVLSYVYEPLDLSDIQDPAIGVSFKNLQKKDSTTKLKALEDLHTYIATSIADKQSLDEAFLRIWTKLFPRTSIDNTNRVRQSCYSLQGKVATLCGKGFVKYMPSTVGPWLAGTFDRDRQVSRAARGSVDSTFATEEKRRGVWKAFQEPILDYCLDTIQKESVQTLSDERTASPDDAQAKYSRAVGGALLTITGLLDTLSKEDLTKHRESYSKCLQSEAVWKLVATKDSGLREAVYGLAISAIDKLPDLMDAPKLGTVLLTQLSVDQKESAYEFLQALSRLIRLDPSIWSTTAAPTKTKKSVPASLATFLGRVAYNSEPEFYSELTVLLNHVPLEILTADFKSDKPTPSKVIAALRNGIVDTIGNRRQNEQQTTAAWQCLLSLTDRIATAAASEVQRSIIIEDALITIIRYYVETSLVDWGRNFPTQISLVRQTLQISWKHCPELVTKEMEGISKAIIEMMQISLPEQAKDFKKSQEAVTGNFRRWYDLQAAPIRNQPELAEIFMASAVNEIEAATSILKSRNGKPYSAANVLELLVIKVPQTSLQQPRANTVLQRFARENIPQLMQSNSASILIRLIGLVVSELDTTEILDAAIAELLTAPRSPTRSAALESLVGSHWPSSSDQSNKLVKAILEDLDDAMKNGSSTWSLPLTTLGKHGGPTDLNDQILSTMLQGLSINNEIEPTIRGFNQLANQNSPVLRDFASSSKGSELLSILLYLSHQGSETVQLQASNLKDAIGSMVSGEDFNPIASIVRNNILNVSETTLPIATLWLQAEKYLADVTPERLSDIVGSLVPDPNSWRASLQPFLRQKVDPTIAMIDSLGGAVYLISPTAQTDITNRSGYDEQGYSAPLRAAIFMSRLLSRIDQPEVRTKIDDQVYVQFLLVDLLMSDGLGLKPKYPVFSSSVDFDEVDPVDIAAELRQATNTWTSNVRQLNSTYLSGALKHLLENAETQDCAAYHHARAYILSTQALEESQSISSEVDQNQEFLARIRKGSQSFADLARLVRGSDQKQNLKLFNELISQLTAAKDDEGNKILENIITVNILLKDDKIELEEVPKQRLVYFVKASVTLLQNETTSGIRAELLKALAIILPMLADIYDGFWEAILQQAILAITSGGDSDLNLIHAALQIYAAMEKILKADPNEDLQEAWTKLEDDIPKSRLTLLKTQAKISDTHSQPLRIVYDLLYRQLAVIPAKLEIPLQDLYPIMQCESTILHRIAYRILYASIGAAQEQISLDAALSNDYIPKLSPELLLLLQEPPHEEDTLDLRNQPELPASLSRYLLGWKLMLSSWNNASYKVRAAYVASLKESSSVDTFLTLCFTSLIDHHGGKNKAGFDPSRLPSITTYSLDNSENPETESLWLLVTIYHHLLLHAPHLAKSWHTNSCPRALKTRVETWTTKYISPLIISSELATLSAWQPPGSNDDPNSILTLKISPKASEATASLPLDESVISIKISLPPSYPLASILLSTDHRTAIDERKWQSYLNISRLIMNFSSSSQGLGCVIDGVAAWRNNVLGALKGHNECAICYSVVAEDGKVPNKKCATCGHLFHGVCLYKWFQRSAGSSCPLCRNGFNYG